jgi:hypothetical protein
MKKGISVIESVADTLVPFAAVSLMILILTEFIFASDVEPYKDAINIVDTLLILVFAVDLSFKYSRIQDKRVFFKTYWIDIIAAIPFYWVFRIVELVIPLFRAAVLTEQTMLVLRETIDIEKSIAEEAKVIAIGSRLGFFSRIVRAIVSAPRLLASRFFYRHPKKK